MAQFYLKTENKKAVYFGFYSNHWPPTHRLLTHRPTDPPTIYPPTYVKIEDHILNMFCIL